MAATPEKLKLRKYELLVQQNSSQWDLDRLRELYCDRGE